MKTTLELAKECNADFQYESNDYEGTQLDISFEPKYLEAFRTACIADYVAGLEPKAWVSINTVSGDRSLNTHRITSSQSAKLYEHIPLYALETK